MTERETAGGDRKDQYKKPSSCLSKLGCCLEWRRLFQSSDLQLIVFSLQVVAGFNRLRQEQRGLASKAAELEMELNEHKYALGGDFENTVVVYSWFSVLLQFFEYWSAGVPE